MRGDEEAEVLGLDVAVDDRALAESLDELDAPEDEPEPREITRGRRKRDVRPLTLSGERTPKSELAAIRADADALERELDEAGVERGRPALRGDCADLERPCPFVSCRHHLYLDVDVRMRGSMKLNFPDLEPGEIPETCSLDVADRGGQTLEETAELMNMTRERVRQIEEIAFRKLRARRDAGALRAYVDDGAVDPGRTEAEMAASRAVMEKLHATVERIYDFVRENGGDVAPWQVPVNGATRSTVHSARNLLVREGRLEVVGTGRGTRWRIPEGRRPSAPPPAPSLPVRRSLPVAPTSVAKARADAELRDFVEGTRAVEGTVLASLERARDALLAQAAKIDEFIRGIR